MCIDACTSCAEVCSESIAHCAATGGAHADPQRLGELMDVVALCRTSIDLMLRGSGLHRDVCAVSADASEFCAEACSTLPDDDLMRRCAEECRRCAVLCRQVAGLDFPAPPLVERPTV